MEGGGLVGAYLFHPVRRGEMALGAAPIALGLIEGVSGAGSSLASLWSGRRADRTRDRRPYLLTGYFATTLKALYAALWFWPWLIVIRTAGWMGRGMRGPMRDTLIAERVDRQFYGRALGFREAMDTLGAVAGPLLGAGLLAALGYRRLFIISAIPGLLSVAAIAVFIRDRDRRYDGAAGAGAGPVEHGAVRLPGRFWRLLWADGLFSIGNAAPSFFILAVSVGMMHTMGLKGAAALGVALYAWHNLVYAATAVAAGRMADAAGPRRILIAGYLCLLGALAGFALLPAGIPVFAALFTLTGLSAGMQESVQKTYVSLALPASVRGRGLGLHASVAGWCGLASGVLVGGLWSAGDIAWGFGAAALFVAASLICLWLFVPEVGTTDPAP